MIRLTGDMIETLGKEQTDEDLAAKNAEIDRIKRDIQSLKEQAVKQLSESEALALSLRSEYDELCVTTTLETEMVNKELAAALEALIGHKLHIQQTLKRIDEQTKNYVEDLMSEGVHQDNADQEATAAA